MIRFKHFMKEQSQSVPLYPSPDVMVHGSHAHNRLKLPLPKPSSQPVKESAQFPQTDEEQTQANQRFTDMLKQPENSHLHPDEPDLDSHKHISKVDEVLDNLHPAENLTQAQQRHILNYTDNSRGLNQDLIDNYKKGTPGPSSWNQEQHDHIMQAINNHSLPTHIKLFSGVKFNPSLLGKETEDGHYIVHIPAFTSTSISKHRALFFARAANEEEETQSIRHMLRIHLPAGHPVIYLGNNPKKTNIATENEAVLPPMTLKIKKNPNEYPRGFGNITEQVNMWEAHPVPKGEDPHTWQPPST